MITRSPQAEAASVRRSLDALDGAGRITKTEPSPLLEDSPCSRSTMLISAVGTTLLCATLAASVPLSWWRISSNRSGLPAIEICFDVLAAVVVSVAVVTGWNVRRIEEPPQRTLAPAVAQRFGSRVIEVSWLGVGPKRRWTWVNSSRPLRWLIGAEPHRQLTARNRTGAAITTDPIEPANLSRPTNTAQPVNATLPANTPLPTSRDRATHHSATSGQANGHDRWVSYVVERGDTWWSLAETHLGGGRRWAELQELNTVVPDHPTSDGTDGTDLRIGQAVRLPVTQKSVEPFGAMQ